MRIKGICLSLNKDDEVTVNISGSLIKESAEMKLLGVTLAKTLNLKNHVNNLCKKASHVNNLCKKARHKLHALTQVSTCADKPQLELTMCSFVMSHIVHLCGCFMIGNQLTRSMKET